MSKKAPADQRQDFIQRLEKALVNARKHLLATQSQYKRDFDKRIRSANNDIGPGDYVFLDPEDGGKKKKKLGGHAVGPYRVLENAIRTFVIQRGEEVERVNSDRVTRAPPPPDAPPRDPLAATTHDMVEKNCKGTAWLFEKILGHRVSPEGPLQFHIEWNGPYQPTWEPRTKVPEEAIAKYFAAKRWQANRKQ